MAAAKSAKKLATSSRKVAKKTSSRRRTSSAKSRTGKAPSRKALTDSDVKAIMDKWAKVRASKSKAAKKRSGKKAARRSGLVKITPEMRAAAKKADAAMLGSTAMTPEKTKAAMKAWADVRKAREALNAATREARGVRFMQTGIKRRTPAKGKASGGRGKAAGGRKAPTTVADLQAQQLGPAMAAAAGLVKLTPSQEKAIETMVQSAKSGGRKPATRKTASSKALKALSDADIRAIEKKWAAVRAAKTAKAKPAKTRTPSKGRTPSKTALMKAVAQTSGSPMGGVNGLVYRAADGAPWGWEDDAALAATLKAPSGKAARMNQRLAAGQVVTAAQVLDDAASQGNKAWVCMGPRRTGCGGGSNTLRGSRQVGRLL